VKSEFINPTKEWSIHMYGTKRSQSFHEYHTFGKGYGKSPVTLRLTNRSAPLNSAQAMVKTPAATGPLFTFMAEPAPRWKGDGVMGTGPWWDTNQLKADISLGEKTASTSVVKAFNFLGSVVLTAKVNHAEWGKVGSGITAQLFVKTSEGWKWHEGIRSKIGARDLTTLTLQLGGISDLNDIRELGVRFNCPPGSSGQTSIYVSAISLG
jgi:mannan endo-1,4-beta-mannosidase